MPGLGGGGGKALAATQVSQRYFPDGAPWYTDVSSAKVAADSSAITQWMVGKSGPGGWGQGHMQVDFSIVAVDVPAGTPKLQMQQVADFFYTPDCDTAPVPVPPGGTLEQSDGSPILFNSPFSGYSCGGFDDGDDCHMLFVSRGERRLYEIYHGTIDSGSTLQAGCLALWDLTSTGNRGDQCTSADAAGFPIAALLFTPEEVAAGHIDHAIRFILPNSMIRQKQYVAPATHGTSTSGPATSGPYGFRMRLKKTYDLTQLSQPAQVVARAMQKYGMLMADGGNIALTAQSDVLSSVKWDDLGFDSMALSKLKATDFDVIDYGAVTKVTDDCTRTPISH